MDLKDARLIWLKGVLFGVILLVSAGLVVWVTRDWLIALLVGLVIWSSARGYYFMFYVIEKYVDPSYRFAGVFDFLRYAVRVRAERRKPPEFMPASLARTTERPGETPGVVRPDQPPAGTERS